MRQNPAKSGKNGVKAGIKVLKRTLLSPGNRGELFCGVVDPTGFEPVTHDLRGRCSP